MDDRFSLRARIASFGHALRGIGEVLGTQHNAWIHAVATCAVVILGVCFGVSSGEWLALVLAVSGVWTAEAMNTAFESLCDAAAPDPHPRVRRAKDVAAGAVLVAATGATAVGILVFVPRLLQLLC